MKNGKFKQLILDVYKEWQNPQRVFTKRDFGVDLKYNNFWGTVYGAISSPTFMDIKDIKSYLDNCTVDMLLLNSRVTDQEVEVYEYQLEDYRIDGDNLILTLRNKEVIFKM